MVVYCRDEQEPGYVQFYKHYNKINIHEGSYITSYACMVSESGGDSYNIWSSGNVTYTVHLTA